MKKAIALAIAMASATAANAAFDTNPTGVADLSLGNLIFTAWTVTDGADLSVNVDTGLSTFDGVGGYTDFTTLPDVSIDLSPLTDAGLDLSTLRWTVFAHNSAGVGGTELFMSVNNVVQIPNAGFSGQYQANIDFLRANQGDDVATVGTEGLADFGADVVTPGFTSAGTTGTIGDTLSFVGFDAQGADTQFLTAVSFDGSTLSFGEVSEVPVPAAAWLFGSALVGLVGVARRRG